MNARVEVKTLAELQAALAARDVPVVVDGADIVLETKGDESPFIEVRGGAIRVVAWENSQPSMEARGNSRPSMEARGNSQPSMEARGNSRPSMVAWENSQPSMVAWENSRPSMVAWENSQPSMVAWENSRPSMEARGNSQPSMVAWENSRPSMVAWENSQPSMVARGNSRPSMEARGNSRPSMEARGNSRPSMEARGNSQPSMVAWENSRPIAKAKGYAQVRIGGHLKLVAAITVAVCITSGKPTVEGAGFVVTVDKATPQAWCDFYGVDTERGYALLYKGVLKDTFKSKYGTSYAPGTTPEAPDWDGGRQECGNGLHFSPTPRQTLNFIGREEARWLACPVLLSEMAVHPDGGYPEKCKAKRVALPTYEVDIDGKPVDGAVVTWPPATPAVATKAVKAKGTKKAATKRKARKS